MLALKEALYRLNATCMGYPAFVQRLDDAHGPVGRDGLTDAEVVELRTAVAPWHLPDELLELLATEVKAAPLLNEGEAGLPLVDRLDDHVSGRGHRFEVGSFAGVSIYCWLQQAQFETSPVIAHNHHIGSVQVLAPSIRTWLACWSAAIEIAAEDFNGREWTDRDLHTFPFGWAGLDTERMTAAASFPTSFWERLEESASEIARRDRFVPDPWVQGERGLGMTSVYLPDEVSDAWASVIWPGADPSHPRGA